MKKTQKQNKMSNDNSLRISAITNILQLVVLIIAVASLFTYLGRRDTLITEATNDISELKSITTDMLKATVLGQAKDMEHERIYKDILRRLDRLETK